MLLAHALRIQPKDVVVLVGGGGKTTAMFRLAEELTTAGQHVVTTMTTHIFVGQAALAPVHLSGENASALLSRLPDLLLEHGHVLASGGAAGEPDRLRGLPSELVNRIATLAAVDAVIVEADGARRLPFKAPADHEPVIPSGATIVVPVAGLDVVECPLGVEHVHRPERVAALTGASLGDPVTREMVATVLAHPDGGAKGVPPAARLVPFLNKADDQQALGAAQQIARLLLAHRQVDSVMIGMALASDPVRELWSHVDAVILAAGEARRYGMLKQVLPWQGRALVAHVAAQALGCLDVDRVVVTVGARAMEVDAALAKDLTGFGKPVRSVRVPDWAEGQSRSVQRGLMALIGADEVEGAAPPGAVLFLLADQPGVSPELLSALIRRHRDTLAPIVAPRHKGRRGNPVLFDRRTFGEFAGLHGDLGARPIIQAHRHEIAWVDWPTAEILHDIDTAADYRQGNQSPSNTDNALTYADEEGDAA